ncbi:hypothetical protein GDO78_022071 [Eleutherodactylus coqui]|uniref:Uncharacterized protein n=1 Tax=Eleutherodactylus coqui TaxID=57060 RepID=A0A8J6BMW7_ELECQ|nr:hypothetical protein GDO78_022071 [Eleutherodactylus coqui]
MTEIHLFLGKLEEASDIGVIIVCTPEVELRKSSPGKWYSPSALGCSDREGVLYSQFKTCDTADLPGTHRLVQHHHFLHCL